MKNQETTTISIAQLIEKKGKLQREVDQKVKDCFTLSQRLKDHHQTRLMGFSSHELEQVTANIYDAFFKFSDDILCCMNQIEEWNDIINSKLGVM